MDDARFDVWMKALAGVGSRRQILRTLTAGAPGLAVSWLGFGAIEARKKRKRKRKRKEKQSGCPAPRHCGQTCCPEGDRCADPATETCATGRGTCAASANSCGGGGAAACNPDSPITCSCVQTMEGATACVDPFQPAYCSSCTTDAECQLPGDPAGMRCVDMSGDGCYCENQDPEFTGLCMPPCPKPR